MNLTLVIMLRLFVDFDDDIQETDASVISVLVFSLQLVKTDGYPDVSSSDTREIFP